MPKNAAAAVTESEDELIARAQLAVSQCNWVVGECAHKWTQKYARGRTDGDFAQLLGLSADQIYQRRRVWETFADVRGEFTSLKWSHFYAALTWDDAPECLQWADENQATVAEMKAWRRALRGEDLTTESADEWGVVTFLPAETVPVKDPAAFGEPDRRGRTRSDGATSAAEAVAGIARDSSEGGDYVPFRKGAGSPAPAEETAERTPRPSASPEQLITRMSSALERINEALSAEVLRAFKALPEKKRNRFLKAVGELTSKTARFL
jgi:hypothetical protein